MADPHDTLPCDLAKIAQELRDLAPYLLSEEREPDREAEALLLTAAAALEASLKHEPDEGDVRERALRAIEAADRAAAYPAVMNGGIVNTKWLDCFLPALASEGLALAGRPE